MAPFTLRTLPPGHRQQPRPPQSEQQHPDCPPARPDAAGPEAAHHQQQHHSTSHAHTSSSRPTRHRVTSHYNTFQTTCLPSSDPPPSYLLACRPRPNLATSSTARSDPLPPYSCTVAANAKLLLNLESVNPLSPGGDSEWKDVHVVLRGTLLSFHRPTRDGGPGKLLRAYTLQHAEVGLATDAQHAVLLPQTRLAHLIPQAARWRAWKRDPHLFRPVPQTLLRLRVETDQILLADADEERIHSLIYALGAAIDIAHAIDERSIPRQCTVPRRRRRPRPHLGGDLTDPNLIAEQERILRRLCPNLASVLTPAPQSGESTVVVQESPRQLQAEGPPTPTREEEEIDLSMFREDAPARPHSHDGTARPPATRQTTNTTITSTFSDAMMYATPTTNFSDHGKWHPPHTRTPAQAQRYIRRCMPILLADASRASDILVSHGKRMKINWRMELLEPWELQPPTYKSHHFDAAAPGVMRSPSQRSATGSATGSSAAASTTEPSAPASASSTHTTTTTNAAEDDCIALAFANQSLDVDGLHPLSSKLRSSSSSPALHKCASSSPSHADAYPAVSVAVGHAVLDLKASRDTGEMVRDARGVLFCF